MAAEKKLQDGFAYPPRWMRGERAAAWTDMSKSKFLELVDQGIMPRGIKVGSMTMWDRLELDAAVENLKDQEGTRRSNPIEKHYGIANDR